MAGAVAERVVEDDVGNADTTPSASASAPGPETDRAPAPAEPDPLDQLLAEYHQGTTPALETPTPAAEQQPAQADPLQEQNGAPGAFDQQVAAQAQRLYEQEAYKAELTQAFNQHCSKVQGRLPDYVPDDYARSELIAMSHTDPRLEIAFEAQFVDRAAIGVELDKVNAGLARARMDPLADPRVILALERRAWQLSVAFHAGTILKQADAAILKKANARKPVDPDLTADHAAVAAAMRGASGPVLPQPAPDLGRMSENEFRDYKRSLGF